MTRGEIKSRVSSKVGGDSYLLGDDNLLNSFINDAIDAIGKETPARDDIITFPSVIGQEEYNLPSNLLRVNTVTWNGFVLDQIAYIEALRQKELYSNIMLPATLVPYQGPPEEYYIRMLTNSNQSIVLGGDPNSSLPVIPVTLAAGTTGNPNGVYLYLVSYTVGANELLNGLLATITVVNRRVSITDILPGPTGTVKRTIYRTKASGNTYYKLVDINDNTTTVYTDNAADASLVTVMPSLATGLSSSNMVLGTFPIPDEIQSFVLSGAFAPAHLSADSDIPQFPNSFHGMIPDYVLAELHEGQNYESALGKMYRGRFEQKLEEYRLYMLQLQSENVAEAMDQIIWR